METRELWRLLSESRLMPAERIEKLKGDFARVKGAGEQANAAALAEWLIAQKLITRYQAKILLAGKSGVSKYEIRYFGEADIAVPPTPPAPPAPPTPRPQPPVKPSAEAGDVVGLFPAPGAAT